MKVFKKAILLIVLICIVSTKTNAYDFEVNGICYNIVSLEDLTCEVTRNYAHYYTGDIIVPDKVLYNGKEITVVRIGKEAFYDGNVNQVTSVKLPNTIKEIGRFAFRYTKISMIDIPNSVKTIEAGAFQDCINLKSFKMGNGIEVIGSNVFSNCINISSVTFNNIISNISEEMFSGCTSLTEVKNVDNIKVIGKKAFSGCKAMQPILPPKIEQIGEYAFDECISVNTLIIPSSCMIIGDHAFSQEPQKIIYKDSSVELKIGIGYTNSIIPFTSYGLFHSIDTVYLGRAIEYIGDTNGWPYEKEIMPLKSVTIGDNLRSEDIKNVNFSRVRHITFGKKITEITDLRSCTNLDSLVIRNETPPAAIGFSNKTYVNCILVVPQGYRAVYESADVWKNFWNIIEITINNDEDHDIVVDDIYYALDVNNKTAEVISNPYGYTGIINIPNTIVYENQTYTVTSIGNNAFDGCTSLTSIAIPSSLKRVKTGAFSGCTSLGKVIIQDIAAWCGIIYDGTDSNGDFPLGRAQHLYSINNTEITEVVIPAGVTRIGALAFRDAKFVTSITIPSSVNYIGREAFRGMHRLTSINLPQSISSIEPYLLQDCEALITINIPEGVTSIGEHAFRKCYALTRIDIPSSVTSIGSYAFRYCNSLTDVYCYAENVPETNSDAFNNSPISSATLHVPEGSINKYQTTSPWSGFGFFESTDVIYNLTYMLNGEVYKTYKVEYGSTITPEPAPTKEGYTFSGWSGLPTTMPAHDVTVTGSFTTNNYTLTYKVDGQVYKIFSVAYGSSISPEPAPTREGYTFSGWSGLPITMPAHDVTVTGSFVLTSTPLDIVITNAGYATFYDSQHAYVLPNGLSAQVVTNVSNGKLTYRTIADGSVTGIIPKGTAVILVSEGKSSGTYTLTTTESNTSYSGTNLLQGSDETRMTTGDGLHYKLSYGKTGTSWDNVFGWYWGAQDGAPFQIEGHKAWLVVPNGGTRAEGFTINGDATEIAGIEPDEEGHDVYYDIQGRRINAPTNRGLYIMNGKKVVIK